MCLVSCVFDLSLRLYWELHTRRGKREHTCLHFQPKQKNTLEFIALHMIWRIMRSSLVLSSLLDWFLCSRSDMVKDSVWKLLCQQGRAVLSRPRSWRRLYHQSLQWLPTRRGYSTICDGPLGQRVFPDGRMDQGAVSQQHPQQDWRQHGGRNGVWNPRVLSPSLDPWQALEGLAGPESCPQVRLLSLLECSSPGDAVRRNGLCRFLCTAGRWPSGVCRFGET